MGILWGSCSAGRFLVVLIAARSGGEAPAAGAAGDLGGVKCLVSAVNFFRNGGPVPDGGSSASGACGVTSRSRGVAADQAGRASNRPVRLG